MTQTTKQLASLVGIAVILGLSGCSASGPASTADAFLEALKSGDETRASGMVQKGQDFDISSLSTMASEMDANCKIGKAHEIDALSASLRVACPSVSTDITVSLDDQGKIIDVSSEDLSNSTY